MATLNTELLKNIEIFSALNEEQSGAIANLFEWVSVRAGEQIRTVREDWHELYIIFSGQVRLINDKTAGQSILLDTLSGGAHFGEHSLFSDQPPEFSAYSTTDLTLLRLSKERLDAFLESQPEIDKALTEYLTQQEIRNFLSNSTVFTNISPEQLSLLVQSLHTQELQPGEFLIREGDEAEALYIIEKGEFKVYQNRTPTRVLAVLGSGELVGQIALISDERQNSNVVAEEPATVFVLPKADFLRMIDDFAPETAADVKEEKTKDETDEEMEKSLNEEEQDDVPIMLPDGIGIFNLKHRLGRFPAVRQQSVMDCGAACLATVCRYYGKHVSLNRMRGLARVGKSGASMLNLLRAAETLGFETLPMLGTYEHLTDSHLPAIVNWNGYHWIVVYKVTDKQVMVADPGQGLIKMSKEEFIEGWTRYTLYLKPTEGFEEVEESKPVLQQFKPYIQPFYRLLLEIGLASLAMQIFSLMLPMFTKFIIDDVIIKQNPRWLLMSLIGISVVVLLHLAISYARQHLLLHVTMKVNLRLVNDFYKHVLSLPLLFFEQRKVGDITSRFEENTKISDFFTGTGLQVFIDTFTAVLYLGLMTYYNLKLTIVAIFFLALHIIIVYVITPHLQHGYRDVFQKGAESQSNLIESLSGLSTIKILGLEHFVRWTWENLLIRYTNAYFKTIKYGMISGLASGIVNNLGNVAVLFYGAVMVMNNQLSVGELVAFQVLVNGVSAPITTLIGVWDTFQETLNAVERLNDVFETEPELTTTPDEEKITLPTLRGHVRFDNMTFRYEEMGKNVLQNITLEVEPGQRVAFVGRSGSGKSTLVKLLLGFYPPSSGNIYIDGFDLADAWLPSIRKQIGVVPQESYLFYGTIKENISKSKPGASLSDIIEAAKLAGAHDFISGFPNGYDTWVEEGASNLSGGQRQRIAIARALLGEPRMLILDEATAALDNESERLIQHNLDNLLKDSTIFMIAHRLSTVKNANLIVVLDRGTIIEQGTHEELMANKRLYYYLATQQLSM